MPTSAARNAGAIFSRSRDAVIRVYDSVGDMIDTHDHVGEFKEP